MACVVGRVLSEFNYVNVYRVGVHRRGSEMRFPNASRRGGDGRSSADVERLVKYDLTR